MRDAWAPLQQVSTAITFIGHTHLQGGFSQKENDWHELRPQYQTRNEGDSWTLPIPPGTRHLINPGSVGQPRDNDWRAAFAIYDTEASEIIYHRVPYDLTAAQGRILMAGLPERLAARLREGR
jgi:diadenosine tetraphosphatase ApaH/serine/threonine PP2A family protein phosphatase